MKSKKTIPILVAWLILLQSCTYFEKEPIVIPVPDETENLEAAFVVTPPTSVNHPYWTTVSDFTIIDLSDQVTGMVTAGDGILNVNGMLNGLDDINEGNDVNLVLRAAYDDTNLYILAEWDDIQFNASSMNWLYNGPEDPEKPGMNADQWTSQRSNDQLILRFSTGPSSEDVWTWSLALSEPMGFALDQFDDGSGVEHDSGTPTVQRNIAGADDRSGPMYEWNGEQQDLDRLIGGFTILDPAYYILNRTAFLGDVANGDVLYVQECEECHGVNGDGDGNFGIPLPLNGEGGLNRLSRTGFDLFAGSTEHSGSGHWDVLDAQEKDDVIGFIRGLSGVPGYYLQEPSGSAADITAQSNVQLALINSRSDNDGYKVLMIRPLITGNSDDIQFDLGERVEFNFEVYLSDNDELNRVGSVTETLIFK